MDFPITVKEITADEFSIKPVPGIFGTKEIGTFVSVRPCAEKYEKKTYLGIYLGDMPISIGYAYNKETQVLDIKAGMPNPAIFVPALQTIIFGAESWWGAIKSESQLRDISDFDIENVWYVKALKQLADGDVEDE